MSSKRDLLRALTVEADTLRELADCIDAASEAISQLPDFIIGENRLPTEGHLLDLRRRLGAEIATDEEFDDQLRFAESAIFQLEISREGVSYVR